MSFDVKNASGNRCSLAYCTSLWSHNDKVQISFFKFPKDHPRCASWVKNCEAKYLPTTDHDVLHKTYKLCSLHFENKMFVNMLKNRLSQSAIPTIFAKKPIESRNKSFVDPQSTEILNVLSENSLMAEYINS